jgi:uncharacterized protein YqfA (UPF0365 family)
MRLLVSALILLAATLDLQFGRSPVELQIAALAAGILLALTVVIDHLRRAPSRQADAPQPRRRLSPDGASG